jgi:predicted metalloendopeptidase
MIEVDVIVGDVLEIRRCKIKLRGVDILAFGALGREVDVGPKMPIRALFDASGRLNNWWTKEDLAHFKASAARLAEQYNSYRPFSDLAVNGKQTLSENIADVAGLAVSFDAYRLSLHGKPAPAAQGFTPEQQFFLSFAQSWRQKVREPALRQRIVTDGHAPAEYRADTVRNPDAWYAAFDVKPGQALYLAPADRVHVW